MGFNDDTQSTNGGFNLQEVYEHKREEHLRNMQDKEDEMRQVKYFFPNVQSGCSILNYCLDICCPREGKRKRIERSRTSSSREV